MFSSLQTGLSGLRANLRYLEVIGNNLANSATHGFKADRVTFKDLFYQSYGRPSGPTGNLGGVNGRQVGTGTAIGSIDAIHTQGQITGTGRPFDLALQGSGFFVVNDGTRDLYTRMGSFGIDASQNFVDTRTGFKVQNVSGSDIDLSTRLTVPANATSSITFGGNLPAEVTGPLAEEQQSATAFADHRAAALTSAVAPASTVDLSGTSLTITVDSQTPKTINFPAGGSPQSLADTVTALNAAFGVNDVDALARLDIGGNLIIESDKKGLGSLLQVSGTAAASGVLDLPSTQASGSEATAGGATDLNDLSSNKTDYQSGDVVQITGLNDQGQAVNVTFTYGVDGTTLGDLVTKINTSGAYTNATASLASDGRLKLTSSVKGTNDMTIQIGDASGGVGSTTWSTHAFEEAVKGTGPDTVNSSIVVFDSLGLSHTLSGVFTRQDDGTWNLDLTIPAAEGSISGAPLTGLSFGTDGTLQGPLAGAIDVTYSNGAAAQTVDLDLAGASATGGLTSHGGAKSAKPLSQDGYEAGELSTFEVTQGGVIVGRYSNGVDISIDTLAIATFQNQDGLAREGSTLFSATSNSGSALIDQAGAAGAGTIQSEALEGSNVDIAEEFVRLIEAQRAFQGNARIVTKTDEMLQELTNIV
jgi:flagellar hook protein FlgE